MLGFWLVLSSALLMTYPLSIYYALQDLEPRYIGLVGLSLVALRFAVARRKLNWRAVRSVLAPTVASALLWLFLVFLDEPSLILFNPVLVNFVMLLTFVSSLFHPPSMIERIARLTNDDLPEAAVAYTRKVTMVWSVFFLLNGLVAAYTGLFSSMGVWALYNGLIVYLIIGLLLGVEYCVRAQIRRTSEA